MTADFSQTIFDHLPDAVFLAEKRSDGHFSIVAANPAMVRLTGASQADRVVGRTPEDLFPADFSSNLTSQLRRCLRDGRTIIFEASITSRDSSQNWAITLSPVPPYSREGHAGQVAGQARDITVEKRQQVQIEYLSYHDQLTGLYNRHYFEDTLRRLNTS